KLPWCIVRCRNCLKCPKSKCSVASTKKKAEEVFSNLKLALQTNTVLALPDYDKPFYLHVDGGAGYMKAVLTQAFGEKQRPLAFYSCKLDSVASGLPTCVQACAAAAEAVKKCHFSSKMLM
uniref:Reverse transcriptase/retrotransposon-derived protein RNase H-like domain-containing protein n=1 Tax=Oreochromis niloticus TaxID=8128 RepID=A0A669EFF8_ORENI